MATQDDAINFQFTTAGQALASQSLAGTAKLDFTKVVASPDNHFADTPDVAGALTDIANPAQTVTLTEVDTVDDDPTAVKIPVVFNKQDVTADYELLTLGLYCKPDGGNEILYAVCALKNPVYMHKTTNPSTYTIDLYVIVGTSANVTIKVDPAGMVTNADLEAILKDYAKKTDLPDMTDVAYKSQVNVFSKQQTLSAGAVNGAGKKALFEGDVQEPDLSGYALKSDIKAPDLSGLQPKGNYVIDNGDNTEQLSGKKVEPWNSIATELPNGADLNTLFDVGFYSMTNVSVHNTPVGDSDGLWAGLIILNLGGSNVPFQIMWGTLATGKVYYRAAAGSPLGWSSWNEALTMDDLNAKLGNYVGIDPNTSVVTNQSVKFNDGQLIVNTQPVVTYAGAADPDEATAKTKSSDGLLHFTIES